MSTMRRRKMLVFGSVFATAVIGGGVAFAVTATSEGHGQLRRTVRYSDVPVATSSTNYITVPNTPVNIQLGHFRQVVARFTAESRCSGGPASSYCSARIRARNVNNGTIVNFQPQPTMDFAFDSASDDFWESNSMTRVAHLGPGTWRMEVQYATTNAANSFRLDDWTLEIDQLDELPVP